MIRDYSLEPSDVKLAKIRDVCRQDPGSIATLYAQLLLVLKRKHSQVRYRCLDIVQVLGKSRVFRTLFLQDHDTWIRACLLNPPPPALWTVKLASRFVSIVKSWESYTGHNTLFAFVARVQSLAPSFEVEPFERPDTVLAFKMKQYLDLVSHWDDESIECISALSSLNQLMALLVPDLEGDLKGTLEGVDAQAEAINYKDTLQSIGIATNTYKLNLNVSLNPVQKTLDNAILFENLKDILVTFEKNHLKWVNKCLGFVVAVDDPDKTRQTVLLKRLIDLKQTCLDSTYKARELLGPDRELELDSDDDEIFEDVPPTLSFDKGVPPTPSFEDEVESIPMEGEDVPPTLSFEDEIHSSRKGKERVHELDSEETLSRKGKERVHKLDTELEISKIQGIEQELDPARRRLLERAPVVEYGDDLFWWDKKQVRFSELSGNGGLEYHHRFLGERQEDPLVSQNTLDQLRKRPVAVTARKLIDIPACRAPLPSGKLCPRRDMVRCPFHGIVIPRNDLGFPLDESHIASSSKSKKVEMATWMAIEDQVTDTLGLQTKRKSTLDDIKDTKNPRQKRLAKRTTLLSKQSQNDLDQETHNYNLREKNAFRW